MPRRWLSMRAHKEENKSTLPVPEGFDFAFGVKSASTLSSPTSPDPKKPFVFGDASQNAKRKPDLTLLIERPQSSRLSSRFSGSHSATLSESSCIGMAFGSPLHPPHTFGLAEANMSPSPHCFHDNPSPARTPSIKKWKKIGGLFRPRSNSEKDSSLPCQQQIDTLTHKSAMPAHRTRWRNPKSPSTQDEYYAYQEAARCGGISDRPKTSQGCETSGFQKFVEAHPIPSIQVKIPGSPFERYSVMFKNLNATPQLGISNKRTPPMETIAHEPSPIQQDTNLISPGLKRRVTSPTTSKPNDTPSIGSKPLNSSRYSLFPPTPTSSRPQSQHRSSNQPLTRPSTAPGQTLPSQRECSPPKRRQIEPLMSASTPKAIHLQKELPCLSPRAVADTHKMHSHSRSSSNGEIFFDVKSLRDSKGQNGTQYEMTRPPSSELQLARSKSTARKQLSKPSSPSLALEERGEPPTKSTSAQIDDTIALVRSLTSSSTSAAAATKEANTMTPKKIVSQHQQVTTIISNDDNGATSDNKTRKSAKSKSESLNIDVPSPVLESTEEATPRTINSRHSIALVSEGPAIAGLDLVASRARANSNGAQVSRARLMQDLPLPCPPAAPVRESKLIPLSKYAPKHTAEDLVRQTGLRPVRPQRSNTDNAISYNNGNPVFRRQFPLGRSCTMPSVHGPTLPRASGTPPISAQRRMSPHGDREMPMVVAYVKPSAEVSIARTVSLSRTPSAKITVSRQPSRSALRAVNHSEEELAEKKVPQRMPTLLEVNSKHKPGLSQNAVLELEAGISSSPASLPSTSDIAKTLDVFPTPPMVTV